MDYHDKRSAQAMIGHALEARGWKLFGYKEDRSDAMTDYYEPERWDGIATLGEYVACVGVGEYESKLSGQAITKLVPKEGGTCERCKGSGNDPLGWTLEAARKESKKFHRERLVAEHPGGTLVEGKLGPGVKLDENTTVYTPMSGVVSPLWFHEHGDQMMHCVRCHGAGRMTGKPESVTLGHYPTFQANPPRCNWHLERNGKILASGTGFATVLRDYSSKHGHDAKVVAGDIIAQKIQSAMEADSKRQGPAPKEKQPMKTESTVAEPEVAPFAGLTIRKGTREGFVELVFGTKPDADTISNLKAAKFRFTCSNGEPRWYGPEANLPERYRDHRIGQRPADPEPASDKDPDPEAGAVANPNAEADETDEPEAETEEAQDETTEGEGETEDAEAEEEVETFGVPQLHSLETLRCNPHVFDGQRCGKGSSYITDGKMLMHKDFVKTKFKHKHRYKKGVDTGQCQAVPDNTCAKILDAEKNYEHQPVEVLGYTDHWEYLFTEKVKTKYIGILRMKDGTPIAINAEYYKLFVKHLDFDAIQASMSNRPLAFFKNGKVVGLLMPLFGNVDERRLAKLIKDSATASATPPKGRERKAAAPATPAAPAQPEKVTPLPLPLTASLALIRGALSRMKVKA